MRVCIFTPAKIGLTETFIRAHVERIPHVVFHVHNNGLDMEWNNQKLSDWHRSTHGAAGKWLNLLPRFLEFRLRNRLYSATDDVRVFRDFLRAQRIDVVLAEYGTAAAEITPACQTAGVPLVAHFHGFDASRYRVLEDYANPYTNLFGYAASVISVSHAMSRTLVNMGCPVEKIQYNPYGPDPSFFEVSPDYSSPTLVAVGRQTFKKAPHLTLEAFRRALKRCPTLELTFVGDGELLEVTESLIDSWGLNDHVHLLGAAERDVVQGQLARTFAMVQHSVRARDGDAEGTPVAILEAGAAGLPVIATRHAGIPDVVIEGQTGFLVPEGDVELMADRIVLLARDRKLAREMGQRARNHVARNFSMERHLAKLDEILCGAANHHSVSQ